MAKKKAVPEFIEEKIQAKKEKEKAKKARVAKGKEPGKKKVKAD